MPKAVISAAELEELLLAELRKSPLAASAVSVTVTHDPSFQDGSWLVAFYNPGNSDARDCGKILSSVVMTFQKSHVLDTNETTGVAKRYFKWHRMVAQSQGQRRSVRGGA